MADRVEVANWAVTQAGSLALKALAEDMPGVHEAKKLDVIEWLLEHDYERLAESHRLTTQAKEKHPDDCPECQQGKHQNCTGWAFNDNDEQVECECLRGGHA